jgi:hypothetical protein
MEKHSDHNHWCANAWVGAPWACGDHHHKENFEHHHHHWCANNWVGAPWACGDDHQHKENFEVDVVDTYAGQEGEGAGMGNTTNL